MKYLYENDQRYMIWYRFHWNGRLHGPPSEGRSLQSGGIFTDRGFIVSYPSTHLPTWGQHSRLHNRSWVWWLTVRVCLLVPEQPILWEQSVYCINGQHCHSTSDDRGRGSLWNVGYWFCFCKLIHMRSGYIANSAGTFTCSTFSPLSILVYCLQIGHWIMKSEVSVGTTITLLHVRILPLSVPVHRNLIIPRFMLLNMGQSSLQGTHRQSNLYWDFRVACLSARGVCVNIGP